jgi:hypothetical protein
LYTHEKITLSAVAKAIARINDYEFAGCYDKARHDYNDLFFVPGDALILSEASELGIHSPAQLFGAVVPYPFVKTKAITHRLVSGRADRPEGWSSGFAQRVRRAVLPGFTAFSAHDARLAAAGLRAHGAIRVKDPLGDGGHGQAVIAGSNGLNEILEKYPEEKLATHGLVLEMNLRRAVTLSIGQITVGDLSIAYHGTQRTVTNNHGRSVYGGSRLVCVRGGWEALEELAVSSEIRLAIAQARSYDQAATEYRGFLATRRNYDVGQGMDEEGRWRSGVFEASWRSGGASTAELAALSEFAQNPAVQVVEASAVKEFGRVRKIPPGSVIHFQGDDPEDGPLVRYTVVVTRLGTQPSLHFTNCKRCARVEMLGAMSTSRNKVAANN